MINKIIKKLGIEKLNEIMIPIEFIENPPKESKMEWKRKWYKTFGYYAEPIVVRVIEGKSYLIDGYTSYLIAKENGKKYVKVTKAGL